MTQANLRQRLLLLSLLPSALLAIILAAYFVWSGIRALEGEMRERGMAVVRYLAPVSEYGLIAGHMESLQNLVQTTVQQPGAKAALVVHRSGRILAVSGQVSLASSQLKQTLSEPGMVADNEQWIAFGAPVVRSLADTDPLFDPSGAKASPEAIGHIFVEFDKTDLLERQRSLLQRGIVIIAIGLLLVALLAIGIADSLTRPVTRLVRAVRAMTLGQFDTRVEVSSFGEFGELERGFNDMATRIAEVHQTMQERIEEATAQLAFQARHDPLTGLINRREFEVRLEKAIAAAQAGGEESSLLFVDLDRFKPINDTCGHLAGDELLCQIARLFQGRLRAEDTVGRLGGDEFAILLNNCVGSRALQVAEEICALTAAYRFIWQDKIFAVGASIGLTTVSRQSRSVAEVLGAADEACYKAKEKGRNRVHVQMPGIVQDRRQADHHPWHDRIAGALAENRLLFDAIPVQPFPIGKSGEHFVEISLRLDDRSAPAVSLAALMDSAERCDLAAALDKRLVEVAVTALARVAAHGRQMRCLVPLSAASVRQRQTADMLASALLNYHFPAPNLYLLLSEEVAARHTAQTLDLCRAARGLGYRVALGDFGAGFASFNYLHAIKPDCVKIGHSLIHDLSTSRSAHILVRAIGEITADQGIESIADGVHELQVLDLLQGMGIGYGQGKAIAPREPFDDWIEGAAIRGN